MSVSNILQNRQYTDSGVADLSQDITQDRSETKEKGHKKRKKLTETNIKNNKLEDQQPEQAIDNDNLIDSQNMNINMDKNTIEHNELHDKDNGNYSITQEEFEREATSVSQNHSQLNTLHINNAHHYNDHINHAVEEENIIEHDNQNQSQSNFVLIDNQQQITHQNIDQTRQNVNHDTENNQYANSIIRKQYQFQIGSQTQPVQEDQEQNVTNNMHTSQIVISYQSNTENVITQKQSERSQVLNDMLQLNNSLKEIIKQKSEQQRNYQVKLNKQQQENLKMSLQSLKNSKKLIQQIKKTETYRQQLLIKSTTLKEKTNIDLFIIQNNKLQIQRVGNKIIGSINNTVVFNIPLEMQYFTFNDDECSIQFGSHYKAKFEPKQYKVHKEKLLVRMGNEELTSTVRQNVIYNETLNSIIIMDDSGKLNSNVSLSSSKKEDLGDGIIMIKQLTGENVVYMTKK